MKRMRRLIFNALAVLSTLLLVVTVGVWIITFSQKSIAGYAHLTPQRDFKINFCDGWIGMAIVKHDFTYVDVQMSDLDAKTYQNYLDENRALNAYWKGSFFFWSGKFHRNK